jgi:hypothetical protein
MIDVDPGGIGDDLNQASNAHHGCMLYRQNTLRKISPHRAMHPRPPLEKLGISFGLVPVGASEVRPAAT